VSTTYSDRDGQVRLHATPSPDPLGMPLALTGATGATRYVGGNASGAPLTGTFAVGDHVVNADGSIFVCTVAGSPGTWVDTATIGPSVSSVFTRSGAVVATTGDYTVAQVTGAAPLASPTLTGTPAAPTAAVDTNTTQLATTAYVVGQGYAKLASPTFTGTVTVPAAAAVTAAPRLNQLSPALTITSGALPTATLSSGTGAQILTTRDAETVTPFTGDGTNNAATCAIALSPDNTTYSTLDTLSIAAGLNVLGALALSANVRVPAGWYLKLTAVHGTIGTTTYY